MTSSILCLLFASFGFCSEAIPSGMTLKQPKPVFKSSSKNTNVVRTENEPCSPYPLCVGTQGPSS